MAHRTRTVDEDGAVESRGSVDLDNAAIRRYLVMYGNIREAWCWTVIGNSFSTI